MTRNIAITGLIALSLAGCAGCAGISASTAAQDATALLSVASDVLAAYKATPNPAPSVISKAEQLLASAQAAISAYGSTSSEASAAVAALTTYLLTAAPGNGVTPASA
jgi:hypothetical protein